MSLGIGATNPKTQHNKQKSKKWIFTLLSSKGDLEGLRFTNARKTLFLNFPCNGFYMFFILLSSKGDLIILHFTLARKTSFLSDLSGPVLEPSRTYTYVTLVEMKVTENDKKHQFRT